MRIFELSKGGLLYTSRVCAFHVLTCTLYASVECFHSVFAQNTSLVPEHCDPCHNIVIDITTLSPHGREI